MPNQSFIIQILVATTALALALSGCHSPTPTTQRDAATPAKLSSASPTLLAAPPVTRVIVPEGTPMAPGLGQIHVLELGDLAIEGTVVGTGSLAVDKSFKSAINDAFVYFTDGDDKIYVARSAADSPVASVVFARTDADGKFKTVPVFDANRPVFANALLPRNRRLSGFGIAGQRSVAVSPASTITIEFLRSQLIGRNLDREAFVARASTQEALIAQSDRVEKLLADKVMPPVTDDEFALGAEAGLVSRYISAGIAKDAASYKGWAAVFPDRPVVALTTLAGNFQLSDNEATPATTSTDVGLHGPSGVGVAEGDDAVYVAETDGGHVKKIKDGKIRLEAGRFSGDTSVAPAEVASDDTTIEATTRLSQVQEIRGDRKGNLAMTFFAGGRDRFHFVGFICKVSGVNFGRTMVAGRFYRLGAPDGREGYKNGALAEARFRNPAGIAFDEANNLYVCDRRHNVIRRIDADKGAVTTVLGDGWPFLTPPETGGSSWPGQGHDVFYNPGNVSNLTAVQAGATGNGTVAVSDYGRIVDVAAARTGSGVTASFNRPLALAWRKVGDSQELYIYDSYNNVVRKATAPAASGFQDGTVATYAGATTTVNHDSGYQVRIGLTGYLDGAAGSALFNFARYNPRDRYGAQVVNGGLAIDSVRQRLYVTDSNNQAIRVIDLATAIVGTIAKNNPSFAEGDSTRVLLSGNLGAVAVLPNHAVAFADRAHHVIRIIHLEHQ